MTLVTQLLDKMFSFSSLSDIVPSHMTDNKLPLNLDKMNIIKFIMNNSPQYPLNIGYNENICRRICKYKIS